MFRNSHNNEVSIILKDQNDNCMSCISCTKMIRFKKKNMLVSEEINKLLIMENYLIIINQLRP